MFAYQTINQQTSLEQDLSVVSLCLCIRGCPLIIPFLPIINGIYHGLNILFLVHVFLVIEVLLVTKRSLLCVLLHQEELLK